MSLLARTTTETPALIELGGGFHAFVQPDGGWGLNNAGVFTGRRGVVLVDTAFTERRGKGLGDAVAAVSDRPVTTIVNTHHHGDHTYANYLFEAATVVAHHGCRERVLATGLDTCHLFPGVEWGELQISEPSLTFDREITVHCDDVPAVARHVGRPAHTTEDVYLWVPQRRLLYAGDLVFNGGTPFVVMGSVQGLIDTLTELRELDADTLVPGHGRIGTTELIDPQLDYLALVQERARDGFAAGLPPLEVARRTDLGAFAQWTDAERLPANIHRAYSELRGEPAGCLLDLTPIVADMVAFNDGPLHSSA